MNKERKKELTNFALQVAKNELSEGKDFDIKLGLSRLKPTFQELIMLDDLVQEFMKKIKKGEIKNEG